MNVNLSQYLRDAALARPESDALIATVTAPDGPKRTRITWAELDAWANDIARALTTQGLVAGQRVAIVMSNRIAMPASLYGVLRGGMVAVPINPRSTVHEMTRIMSDCAPKVVLCDDSSLEQVRQAVGGMRDALVVVDGADAGSGEMAFADFVAQAEGPAPVAPQDRESLAVILYTSGTSGKPRGAMLSHRALIANIEQVAAIEPATLTPDDVCLGLLPLFHIYGLNALLGQAVRQCAPVVLVDRFDPSAVLQTIRDERITQVALAPPVVAAWAGRDDLREMLAGVKTVICGAASLDPSLVEAFYESSGHHIEQGYGLTETAPVITATLARADRAVPAPAGSVGPAIPGVDVRIVDASGRAAAPDDPAEVWVRGDNVFSGYWPDGADGPRDDGWYPTGDIGYLDNGFLMLVDRLRELVIVSGFNVYPFEVEDQIAAVDGVEQVAVVGQPDPSTGEAVVAFVVVADGHDQAQVLANVEARCAERLARFKRPSHIVAVDGFPHSATGKVAKGRLRALARSHALGLDAARTSR